MYIPNKRAMRTLYEAERIVKFVVIDPVNCQSRFILSTIDIEPSNTTPLMRVRFENHTAHRKTITIIMSARKVVWISEYFFHGSCEHIILML